MTAMTEIFGEKLLISVDKEALTKEVMKDKDIVLLYFSASWCPPCKRFTPTLSDFYNKHCKGNRVEIVYISSDYDVPSFAEYYNKMPWCSLPPTGRLHSTSIVLIFSLPFSFPFSSFTYFCSNKIDTAHIKQKIADRLRISGIPSLVALDKNGLFLSDHCRNDVTYAAGNETKCKELINKWKSIDAIPIEDAKLSGSGPRGVFSQILMKLLSNPMYMVGLYYLFKKLMIKFQDISEEQNESEL
jgi:nucleoredoxin